MFVSILAFIIENVIPSFLNFYKLVGCNFRHLSLA